MHGDEYGKSMRFKNYIFIMRWINVEIDENNIENCYIFSIYRVKWTYLQTQRLALLKTLGGVFMKQAIKEIL